MYYSAPGDAMVPQTLMGVFASVVTYTVTCNADGYIKDRDETLLLAMQIFCGLTWVCWIGGATAKAQ